MNSLRTAVVLCGGEGLRLRPMTIADPKAMVQVSGRPLLEWVISWLRRNGIRRVVLGVAYRKEKIIKHFSGGGDQGMDISYSVHTVRGGTAEGFRLAIGRYVEDETFLAMNGDEITDIRLSMLSAFHERYDKVATIAVGPLRSPYGIVDIKKNLAVSFREKPTIQDKFVSIGTYVFEKSILKYLPKVGDVEQTTFPLLARQRKLAAYRHTGFWATINTIKDLADVENQLRRRPT